MDLEMEGGQADQTDDLFGFDQTAVAESEKPKPKKGIFSKIKLIKKFFFDDTKTINQSKLSEVSDKLDGQKIKEDSDFVNPYSEKQVA